MNEKSAVTSVREVRQLSNRSQAKAAAIADVSIGTWRMFEIDRNAVTPKARAKCDKAVELLTELVKSLEAA